MTRRELLTCCSACCLAAGLVLTANAQQPQAPGRARIQTPAAQQPKTQTQTKQPLKSGVTPTAGTQDPPPRQQRPAPELKISKELEDLLVVWERESAKIKKLRGPLVKYTYDSVYSVEKRADGQFWFEAPDQGRIDFEPSKLTGPSTKKNENGIPFTVAFEDHQRWICTGKQIFLIHDDQKLYDTVEIPVHQQGKNIINGPLPFLFGLKAEQAKQRYHLSFGSMHWPQGKIVKDKDGREVRYPPQIHIVAAPKLEVDAKEWSRAEVILTDRFLPTAIRLTNPQGSAETVYKFIPREMKVNETFWLNNPFNDRPPAEFTRAFDKRATNDDKPVTKTQ
ncbi:MAG: hypothetical protein U0992_05830 [Planctomycetaceae bacterium]